jgi:diguanylate cyclase (GGDEF)-like protein
VRIFGRNDVFLLGGLAIALWVVSSRQLGTILDHAREIDHSRGLQLVPGLFILAVVFLIHQFRKRGEMRAEANAATSRIAEMERLVQFGQALAHSLDGDSIRTATTEHLPMLASGRQAWAMIRTAGDWMPLTPMDPDSQTARERTAARAIGDHEASRAAAGDDVCFPLIVAGTAIGAIGISPTPALSEAQRSVLAAAAALLAASVKNAELFLEVHENSVRDALTGCFNRRHTVEVLDSELRRARRSHAPFSVVMFDLDHFKTINDRFGHLCGDAVLAHVGQRMKAILRGSDVKCRYGGEEFLVLLPDTPTGGAHRVAEMLRKDLEQHPVYWNDQTLAITASFGIADMVVPEDTPTGIIARADGALYHAKQNGRNCVRTSEPSPVQYQVAGVRRGGG